MKNQPAKQTIDRALRGVREWTLHGFNNALLYTIRTNFGISKLRKATVQIVGPGKSDLELRSKLVNNILRIDNKNFMVKLVRLRKKSKMFSVGDQIEIQPKFLKEL